MLIGNRTDIPRSAPNLDSPGKNMKDASVDNADAYKCDGKKGFMEYRFTTGTLFITNKRIILSAPGGFDYPLYTLTYTKEYDDGILFQFGEKLIVMGIATSRQAYKVLEMLR